MDVLTLLSGRLAMLARHWKEKLVTAQGDAFKVYECTVDIEKSIEQENLWTDIAAWLGQCLKAPPSVYKHPDRAVMLETFLDIISSQSQENIQDYIDCYELLLNQRQKNIMFTKNETDFDSDLTEYDYGESEGEEMNHIDLRGEEECPSEEESKRRAGQKTDEMERQKGRVNKDGELFQRYCTLASNWKEKLDILESGVLSKFIKGYTFDEFKKPIVEAICSMKSELAISESHSAEFHEAVKETGLMRLIETICDPTFLIQHRDTHNSKVEQIYRIADQLGRLAQQWIPPEIVASWANNEEGFHSNKTTGPEITKKGPAFLKLFDKYPALIPGEEHHDYIFFLTSFESFCSNYKRWLGPWMDHLGYNLSWLNTVGNLKKLYDSVLRTLSTWCIHDKNGVRPIDTKNFKVERWRTILKMTHQIRQLSQKADKFSSKLAHCSRCAHLSADKRCVQYRYFPHRVQKIMMLHKELRGAGICMVPVSEQMIPKLDKDGNGPQKPVYHPGSVGESKCKLVPLEPDPGIRKGCGHQLILIVDEPEDKNDSTRFVVDWKNLKNIVDFVWWDPFDDDILAIMQENVVESTGVKPIKRGGQFRHYSGHDFGGRKGDTLTAYAGLEGGTDKGINILFRQAQTSAIMQAVAKHAHPELVKLLEKVSANCDRLGMSGANLYNATSYIAPIHRDRDASRGLCAQFLLKANSKYYEFGFCNIEFQYYIRTSTNCLWSFNSSDLHGTMLPSEKTVQRLNSHAYRSSTHSGNQNQQSRGSGGNRGGRGRGQHPVKCSSGTGPGIRRSARIAEQDNAPGPTVSNGAHVTTPNRNYKRAQQNAQVRNQYQLRSTYWRGQ
ncbi:hypothetical protein BDP27DRAFT_1311116 [Rhodocollybia butyracea]|uniref:Uncharacterized protein n=1 Tax=Rhodocollybia butyracea TaxID=206335 RepID=A0A9P5Q9N9_9AGAR|nr:hypothetical protein BDP27DRAFT_1311116 [Rhodocollybia butyracea]